MILRTETVEQHIDQDRRATLVKQIVMTSGREPLAIVRKRLPEPATPRAAVLLIHGFGQNHHTWHVEGRSLSAHLAARGYDVFNVDLRGHGRSRRFGARRPRVLDDYIREDAPSLAREALALSGADRLFLVGHSMGGLIAYAAGATDLREQVRGIVTVGSPYRFGLGSRTLVAGRTILGIIRATGLLDRNPVVPARAFGRHLRRRRTLWNSRLVPIPVRAWSPDSIEEEILEKYLERAFDRTSMAVAYDIFRGGSEAALTSHDGSLHYGVAFEHLDVPLLVIAGSEDGLAPPASVKPAYDASRSADKTYRVFPLGHLDLIVGRRAPSTVWSTIDAWLDRR